MKQKSKWRNMMSEIDLKEYSQFVDKVTSEESKDSTAFRQRLDDQDC